VDPTESFQTAYNSLKINKMRAWLTTLGVIIGVAAVIALLSVGKGVNRLVEEQIRSIGTNFIQILPDREQNQGREALSVDDVDALADPLRTPAVEAVAAEIVGVEHVFYGERNYRATLSGATANYISVRSLDLAFGSELTARDVADEERVIVLGWDVYKELFSAGEYPIGETVKVQGISFEVIGVLDSQEGFGFTLHNEKAYVPISTAHSLLYPLRTETGERAVSAIYALAADESLIGEASEEIKEVLRERHEIAYQTEDDFTLLSQTEVLDAFRVITDILTLFLGVIAGISLVVGGIGIMNIMLVSVTERTREIGIRKAVGARKRHILVQFLIESLALSLVGGLVGIGLGIVAASAIGTLSEDLIPVVDAGTILIAFGFAAAVGLVFGIYPAWQAADLRPIEALRYE
jgi:putative ABC transport system permease protein